MIADASCQDFAGVDEQPRGFWRRLVAVAILLSGAAAVHAAEQHRDHLHGTPAQAMRVVEPVTWCGEARTPMRSWDLCLDLAPGAPTLSVPSLWIASAPVEVQTRGNRLELEFPWGMGTIQARRSATRITGQIRFKAGPPAAFELVPATRPGLVSRPLRAANGGVEIAADLVEPPKTGRMPAVVILHGGGDSSRADSPAYRFWADFLPRHGYAAVVYDKRGNGQSAGDWRNVGFEERAADVEALVAALRAQPEIDPERVGLLAISQGSWVATLVAARDPRLCFVAQLSGPAVSPYEADTFATERAAVKHGLEPTAVEQYLTLWRLLAEAVRRDSDASWRAYDEAVTRAQTFPWAASGGYDATRRDSWFPGWYRRIADFEPAPVLQQVTVPMLWLYGAMDTQSDVQRNVAVLARLMRENSRPFAVHVFPSAGHSLLVGSDPLGRDDPPLTIAPGFFTELLAWMDASARRSAGR